MKSKEISLISLLAVIISITGLIKIPGVIPGTEFQLSAPVAIGIAVNFGFRRYLTAGIISSLINLLVGTHTIVNVAVSMIFRIVAGGLIHTLGSRSLIVILSGPIGTIIARIVLAKVMGKGISPLLIAAFPGMIYTALFSIPVSKFILKIKGFMKWTDVDIEEKIF